MKDNLVRIRLFEATHALKLSSSFTYQKKKKRATHALRLMKVLSVKTRWYSIGFGNVWEMILFVFFITNRDIMYESVNHPHVH